jgi:hypothetical protein
MKVPRLIKGRAINSKMGSWACHGRRTMDGGRRAIDDGAEAIVYRPSSVNEHSLSTTVD